MKASETNGDPVSGPDIVDTEPSRSSNQANPPNTSGANSRWPNTNAMGYMDRLRSGNAPTFGSGMFRGFGNEGSSGDMSASPDAGLASDRPTPNSSTSASDRHNGGSSHGFTGNSNRSGRNSFEASPASSTNNINNNNGNNNSRAQQDQLQSGNIDAFFQNLPGGDFPTGLTPGQQFTMPDTPGKTPGGGAAGSNTGDFNWEQFTSGTTGMTPVSEGVLRTMLQMGPMETMDMGWDAQP